MSDALDKPYDLFISHAVADRAWVEGYLLDALTSAGVRCYREAAFALGVPRLVEFENGIRKSRRILLVLSPAYLADDRGQFVDLLAQTFGLETASWPVIPLLLQHADLPARLDVLTGLDATNPVEREAVVARLCSELKRPVPAATFRPPCPYPGMVSFREDDAARFYGRKEEVEELVERLRLHRFLAVIGPSGSGKSSLVFAGLVPALRKSRLFGIGNWLVRTVRPGEAPLLALAFALGESGNREEDATQIVKQVLSSEPEARRLLIVVDQFEELFTVAETGGVAFQERLLRLSQMPDVFVVLTVRADFYANLMGSVLWREVQAHRVEVAPLDEHGLREAILEPAEGVGVFVEAALVERLVGDAGREPGMLPFVQETLVLLWERLERRFLALHAYESIVLPRRAYKALGSSSGGTGLQVAMARRADAALAWLSPEQQALARRIFLRLVQFGRGRTDTRRQEPVTALASACKEPVLLEKTLQHLAEHRLLTLSGDEKQGGRTVDIAHEALIGGWPTLRQWVDERREAEQTRRRLEAKAAEWVRLGRGKGGLLDEATLPEAERWLESADAADLGHDEALSGLVLASREAIEKARSVEEASRQRELEQAQLLTREQQRSNRNLRMGVVLSLGLATVSLSLAALAFWYWTQSRDSADSLRKESEKVQKEAERAQNAEADALKQRDVAEARRLAALAAAERPDHPDTALLLDYESYQRTPTSEARDQLLTFINQGPYPRGFLNGHERTVRSMAFRQDGTCLATADETHILLWDLTCDPPARKNRFAHGNTDGVSVLVFSPDGKRLASAGKSLSREVNKEGMLKKQTRLNLWDCESGSEIRAFSDGDKLSPVLCMAFSPDGNRLAWGGGTRSEGNGQLRLGELRVWDLTTDQHTRIIPPQETTPPVRSVACGRGGVIAAYDGKEVSLWEVADGNSVKKAMLEGAVGPLAFSPDGRFLASWGKEEDRPKLFLWDLSGGKPKRTSAGNWGVLPPRRQLAFSPDGKTLATAGLGGVSRWDVADSKLVHIDTPFIPDDDSFDRIADGYKVNRGFFGLPISLFPKVDRNQLAQQDSLLYGALDGIAQLGMSREGAPLLASTRRFRPTSAPLGNRDNTIILWGSDAPGPEKTVLSLKKNEKSQIIALSSGGNLASIRSENEIVFWEIRESEPIRRGTLDVPSGPDWSWNWATSSDGTKMAAANTTDIIVWDVSRSPAVKEKQFAHGHTVSVSVLAFTHDGKRLASGGGKFNGEDPVCGELKLWDLESGRHADVLPEGSPGPVGSVAFSPNDNSLATGLYTGRAQATDPFNATVLVWDLDGIQAARKTALGRHVYDVLSLAFSPDGKSLAASGGYQQRSRFTAWGPAGELSLWRSVADGEFTQVLYQRTEKTTDVAFSRDGTTLACVEGRAVSLWDVATRRKYETPFGECDGPVAFLPDGKTLASCGTNAAITLWNLDATSWAKRAGRVVNRNFYRSEWARFFPDMSYRPTFPQLPPGDGVTP
jgi:WD40 repeat protein